MKWSDVCVDSLKSLLRYGRKNSGGWDDCRDHEWCGIPDDGDVDELLRDARLGQVVMEYRKETGSWPGNNDYWWDKFKSAEGGNK